MNKKLDLDTFGDIIDKFLKENEIRMLLTLPEGAQEVQVEDNCGLGPIVQFFIMLNSITAICESMKELLDIDGASPEWADCVDELLDMVREDILAEDEE